MGTVDLSEKEPLPDHTSESKKCCVDCRTTRTPLYRKKMVSVVRLRKGRERKRERTHKHTRTHATSSTSTATITNTSSATATTENDTKDGRERGLSKTLKVRLMALGKEVLSHRLSSPSVVVKKQRCHRRRKLGEEEQAAVLLMALSCGSVFA
ncbi:GATA transcription factor [Parasponia andersonii]|uniref:GATA transcription factor n=1 Tax=Parasponia andersonii TaxID=3476 RepID=A0A2P5D162_PARAD|nr:GATA transcription factor [Parasponia andersonii]